MIGGMASEESHSLEREDAEIKAPVEMAGLTVGGFSKIPKNCDKVGSLGSEM